MQVQADDIRPVRLDVRIRRHQVALEPWWFEAVLAADAAQRHVRQLAQRLRKFARGPRRGAVRRVMRRRPRKHCSLQPIRHLVPGAPRVAPAQPRPPIRGESPAPARDATVVKVQRAADLSPCAPVGPRQDQARPPRRIGPPGARPRLPFQFRPCVVSLIMSSPYTTVVPLYPLLSTGWDELTDRAVRHQLQRHVRPPRCHHQARFPREVSGDFLHEACRSFSEHHAVQHPALLSGRVDTPHDLLRMGGQ